MDKTELTAKLKAKARELGADAVGVAPAELPAVAGGGDAYRAWLGAGMHGGMTYMERAKEAREHARNWFPRARSVIMCAFSYYDGRPAPQGPGGRVARYAQAPDYHPELAARMRALLGYLEELVPPTAPHGGSLPRRGRVFVDTSPLLERLYARFAGLGWIGKNTMALSRRAGSLFFLTGLAVDQELACDSPVTDHCGSCTRCLDACPTDAFAAPRVLDASKCVAYFTIESPAPVPAAFRAGHGDWIFGCDVCQDVCPWNKFAPRSRVFAPRLPARLDIEEIAALSEEAFAERYAGTPLERAGRRSLIRNALLAMGNSGETRYRATLQGFAGGDDALLAEQAAWSLGQLVE